MSKSKQHYLPAQLIGRFSDVPKSSLRESKVFVQRRWTDRVFCAKAESICCSRGLYDYGDNVSWPIDGLDGYWQHLENNLPVALNELINGEIKKLDFSFWINTLVPFVASLFVRGLEFENRYMNRYFYPMPPEFHQYIDVNVARGIESDRLLALVMSSDWEVFKIHSGCPADRASLVNNELGVGRMLRPYEKICWLVPLDQKTALAITPRRKKQIAFIDESMQWHTMIKYNTIGMYEVANWNSSISKQAQELVFGNKRWVNYLSGVTRTSPRVGTEMILNWASFSKLIRPNTMSWHQVLHTFGSELTSFSAIRQSLQVPGVRLDGSRLIVDLDSTG